CRGRRGMSFAARARRLAEDAEIVVLERDPYVYVSCANCGLPYGRTDPPATCSPAPWPCGGPTTCSTPTPGSAAGTPWPGTRPGRAVAELAGTGR
ncbi:MAG TPA: hypothetical protein VMV07_08295, partial [Streptosporangiaceae bacterium]|nr:hypothetical protein [Streptosporangiaceae bacterium]